MGGINLNESGLDFVRQVFVTFGGNTTVLTLFLLSVLYLALKGKKEERYVFVTTAVFLAFTVYNPFAVKYILGKLGMVNVYYRFFWILPMVLTIGYACTKVVGGQKKGCIALEFYSADDREALMEARLRWQRSSVLAEIPYWLADCRSCRITSTRCQMIFWPSVRCCTKKREREP